MTKWEYCIVGPIKTNFGGYYPRVTKPQEATGILIDESISGRSGHSETDVLRATIVQLGEEGWEMVGCGSMSVPGEHTTHLLYFKRPKS